MIKYFIEDIPQFCETLVGLGRIASVFLFAFITIF
jgi:hypothetical protein